MYIVIFIHLHHVYAFFTIQIFNAIRNINVFTVTFCTANTYGTATYSYALLCASLPTINRYFS